MGEQKGMLSSRLIDADNSWKGFGYLWRNSRATEEEAILLVDNSTDAQSKGSACIPDDARKTGRKKEYLYVVCPRNNNCVWIHEYIYKEIHI